MSLDLPTLMVMQSFAMACAGAVLIFAWLQNRTVSALAVWGVAHLSGAAGILSLMLGVALQQPLWSAAGGVLLCSQSSLVWKAVRNIAGRPAPLPLMFLGPAAIVATAVVPQLQAAAAPVAVATGAAYTVAVAVSLWLGRHERLIARWPLMALAIVHALALVVGTFSTFVGSTGADAVPPIMSLFGVIYFESIIFALGTTAFAIALVKERNEVVSLAAARTDALTGIANRAAFLDGAAGALERCRRDGAPASVVMFDLAGC
jgi:predicted signal transduction protein with EAL and GGDEF domain